VFAQKVRICYKAANMWDQYSTRLGKTNHFPRIEPRAPPCLCFNGSTVEAKAVYTIAEFNPCIIRVDRPEGLKLGKWFIKFAAEGVRRRERKVKPWDTLIVRTHRRRKPPAIAAVITVAIVDHAFMYNLFKVRSSGRNVHDRSRLRRNLLWKDV
jgi:hypothetical protein